MGNLEVAKSFGFCPHKEDIFQHVQKFLFSAVKVSCLVTSTTHLMGFSSFLIKSLLLPKNNCNKSDNIKP